jgi:transcriptional regulator with XRE-family HTH domain
MTPISVARALRVLGEHVSNWRKLNRLTAAQVAERANISRDTLRAIEQGKGSVSTENLLRVLRILGIMDGVVAAADPYSTDVGRLRMDEILPKRVRGLWQDVIPSRSHLTVLITVEEGQHARAENLVTVTHCWITQRSVSSAVSRGR